MSSPSDAAPDDPPDPAPHDPAPDDPIVYVEPGARYTSTAIMTAFVVIGFVVDCLRSGKVVHVLGWVIGGVLIVGANLLIVRAARSLRTITVTGSEIRVGDQWLERAHVVGIDTGDATAHVLGQTPHTPLQRGVPGLRLALADGAVAVIATRRPAELMTALALAAPAERGEPAIEVRTARDDEYPALPVIAERAAALYTVAGQAPPRIPTVAELRAAAVVLVALGPSADEPLAGFIALLARGGSWDVAHLAVLPSQIRRGVGPALRSAAEDYPNRP